MQFIKYIALTLPLISTTAIAAESPFTKPDGSWINISGTAVETNANSFTLDYGKGTILVEMDDWSWADEEGAALFDGDEVRVYGEIDDDLAEVSKIEASSVYVENLGTYFYANSDDEETTSFTDTSPIDVGETTIIGTVTNVDAVTDEFTIDKGIQSVTIDTTELFYDPLDNIGYQQIDVGDLVSVDGYMQDDLLESMELMAEGVTVLD